MVSPFGRDAGILAGVDGLVNRLPAICPHSLRAASVCFSPSRVAGQLVNLMAVVAATSPTDRTKSDIGGSVSSVY